MIAKSILESQRQFARKLMFWLGTLYLVICINGMTPYTFQLDDIKITLVHVLGPILIVAYLILLAKRWVDPPRPLVFVPFLLYMGVMVLSTQFSVEYGKWVGWQMTLFQWALLGPYLAFMVGCSDRDGARRGLKLFAVLLLYSTAFGLLHRLGLAGYIYKYLRSDPMALYSEPSFMLKMSATFASAQTEMMSIILNRDFYGCFLALTIPITVGVLLITKSHIWQAICIATLFMAGICLVLTNSKDSWAATAIAVGLAGFMYLFVAQLKIQQRKQVFMIGGALAVAMIGMAAMTWGMLLQQIKSIGMSFASREIIWGGAIGIWKDNPILGAGPGSYRMFFPLHRRADYFLYDISHVTISAHNYFLDLLCDTGFLGFVTLMTFLGILYWKNFRHVRLHPDRDQRIISMCLLAGMTGFFLNSLTSPCPRWAVGAVNLWSALGMLAAMIQYPVVRAISADSAARETAGYARTEGAARQSVPAGEAVPSASLFAPLRAYQTPIAVVLLVVCGGLALYSVNYGINFFKASIENNKGVSILGDESRPGPVAQLREMIQQKRQQLSDPNLSVADQEKYEQELASYESMFDERRNEGIQHFENAVKMAPSMVTSWYKLASLYSLGNRMYPQEEDFQKALKAYLQIQRYWPEYSQTQYNLGTIYLGLSNFAQGDAERQALTEKALSYLKQAASMSIDIEYDTNIFYIRTLLQVANEMQNPVKAQELRAEALGTAKRLVKEWDRTLGYVSIPKEKRKPEQAAYELRNSVRRSRYQQEKILLDVANIYAEVARTIENRPEALKGLKRLHELSPGDESVNANLFALYRQTGDNEELGKLAEEILDENPLNLRARFWMGVITTEKGNLKEARRQALIIDKIEPNFPDGDYLNFLIYDRAGNAAKARQYAVAYLKSADDAARKKAAEDYLKKSVESSAPASAEKPAEKPANP